VWGNLSASDSWGSLVGWVILLATTFTPVVGLWGANRVQPDDPLVPPCVAISVIGGAVGMSMLYPRKGYRLPGLVAGPLFGPGCFLAFWLVAPAALNKLILLGLLLLGGAPSFALYVFLLCRRARQAELG
jgi:hypothetical protein